MNQIWVIGERDGKFYVLFWFDITDNMADLKYPLLILSTHTQLLSRVKCSVCGNSWYQSRDRLFDIPSESHDLLPAEKSDLDRIALNLSKDLPAGWMGDYKLYVGNLDFRTTASELRTFFDYNAKKEGSVCDVSIVKGADGRSRGFAFVTFYDAEDGKVALENGNGMECNGRELAVREPNN